MNENENNFESLRRLLAFKNRETPPLGYFNNFSAQVVSRIRAAESRKSAGVMEQLFAEAPWLLKFVQAFEFKPAFAGVFASALCLVLVFGIVNAERPDAAPQPLLTQSAQVSSPLAMASPTDFVPPAESSGLMTDSNSVLNLGPVASLFNQPDQLAQQVSFTIPGN
jgi:hypothetical protein